MNSPIHIIDQTRLNALVRQFSQSYLLLGSGPRLQYADPERALRDVLAHLDLSDQRVGVRGRASALIIFGGDSADEERPDLGYLVRCVKRDLNGIVEVLSVQSWPEPCPFADYIFTYPRAWSDDPKPRELWGGTVRGVPVAATRYYLSAEMQATLSAVICIGGGEIARRELMYTVEQGVVQHHYIRAEVRYPKGQDRYGPAYQWYTERAVRRASVGQAPPLL